MQPAEVMWGLLMVVMGTVWLFVPFAIFSCRSLLARLLAEQQRTNALLTHIGGRRIPPPEPEPVPWVPLRDDEMP